MIRDFFEKFACTYNSFIKTIYIKSTYVHLLKKQQIKYIHDTFNI